jgi:putative aldouronate transport system substrate-binding protein
MFLKKLCYGTAVVFTACIIGALGGCRDSGESKIKRPASITWMVHDGLHKENASEKWAAEYERLTGVKINLQMVSNNEYKTLRDLAFASGDKPDVFDLDGTYYASFAAQGAICDLTDIIKTSPLFKQADSALWNSIAIKGRYYGIPKERPNGTVTYVRKDWLDRLGMKEPGTYDEFIAMLRQFKTKIPECSVPFTAPGLFEVNYLREFYQDASTDFVYKNGRWVDGMADENMAQALNRLQSAYKEGLIDMEIITNKTSTCRDIWYSGACGVFNYWAGGWADTLSKRLASNIKGALTEPVDAIAGSYYIRSAPSVLCIPSDRKPDRIRQIYTYFFEFRNDGTQGQLLFQNGVKDVHWKQEGVYLVPLPTVSDPRVTQDKVFTDPDNAIVKLALTDKMMKQTEIHTRSIEVLNKNYKQLPVFPVSRKYAKISSDLKLLREDILAKVVMGKLSVAEGLRQYRTDAENLGIDEVIDDFNK